MLPPLVLVVPPPNPKRTIANLHTDFHHITHNTKQTTSHSPTSQRNTTTANLSTQLRTILRRKPLNPNRKNTPINQAQHLNTTTHFESINTYCLLFSLETIRQTQHHTRTRTHLHYTQFGLPLFSFFSSPEPNPMRHWRDDVTEIGSGASSSRRSPLQLTSKRRYLPIQNK